MKKIILFLTLSATILINPSFASQPASAKKGQKKPISGNQQPKNPKDRSKLVSGAPKPTNNAGKIPKREKPKPAQTKTGDEKKSPGHTNVPTEIAAKPKIGNLKNDNIQKKYSVAKYDPSDAIEKESDDKLEALNNSTEEVLTQKAKAYFTTHPKVNKKDAISGFIETFKNDHFATYKRHYLEIKKHHVIKAESPQDAFTSLLSAIKQHLEDEYVGCECTIQ